MNLPPAQIERNGERGVWYCYFCSAYVDSQGVKDNIHRFCGRMAEWHINESIQYGYYHEPGIGMGVWHIILGLMPSVRTLCENDNVDKHPIGVHIDYTEPDEGKICKHCIDVLAGRRKPPSMRRAFIALKPMHTYKCLYVLGHLKNKRHCGFKFEYLDRPDEIECGHWMPGVKYEHLCCAPEDERDQADPYGHIHAAEKRQKLAEAKMPKLPTQAWCFKCRAFQDIMERQIVKMRTDHVSALGPCKKCGVTISKLLSDVERELVTEEMLADDRTPSFIKEIKPPKFVRHVPGTPRPKL